MERLIKPLIKNRKVIFDKGRFDSWCVYIVEDNKTKKAPFDTEYFSDLKTIASQYKEDKVYQDFVLIYDGTTTTVEQEILDLIDTIVLTYHEKDKGAIEQWFTVLYAGMIAEESKTFAILKKRIKRLGIHQILKLGYQPEFAANFSKGKKWQELDLIMKSLGF